MNKHSCLSIYYTGKSLTALVLEKDFAARQATARYHIETGQEPSSDTIEALRAALDADGHRYDLPVTVALGVDYYQSQEHHSEFSDAKQLDQTLKYDVEEIFAREGDSLAVGYQFRKRDTSGSDLLVYAGDRSQLNTLFERLAQAKLDALQVRPDVVCWTAYLRKNIRQSGSLNAAAAVSEGVLYLLFFDESMTPCLVRTLRGGSEQRAEAILERELLRSLAMLGGQKKLEYLYYHENGLSGKAMTGLSQHLECHVSALAAPRVDEAFAQGAGICWFENSVEGDMRRDGMTPRSFEIAKRNAWWGLSAAATLLMLVWGTVLQINAGHYQELYQRRETNMKTAYQMVFNKDVRNLSQVQPSLNEKKREISKTSAGRALSSLSNSASYTMSLVFEALEKLADEFDLQIDSIRFNENDAMLSGSVLNLQDRDELEAVIKTHGQLEVTNWDYTQNTSKSDKAVRRSFNMSIKVKK